MYRCILVYDDANRVVLRTSYITTLLDYLRRNEHRALFIHEFF
jgi:phenylalanyl-tRNA synthetase beta subunit